MPLHVLLPCGIVSFAVGAPASDGRVDWCLLTAARSCCSRTDAPACGHGRRSRLDGLLEGRSGRPHAHHVRSAGHDAVLVRPGATAAHGRHSSARDRAVAGAQTRCVGAHSCLAWVYERQAQLPGPPRVDWYAM